MDDRMSIDDDRQFPLTPHPSSGKSRVEQLSKSLVRTDAIPVFASNIEKVYEFWVLLQLGAAVPSNVAEAKSSVVAAFHFLDSIINDGNHPRQLSRLGHVALTSMLDRLKGAIGASRRQGRLKSRSGHRNASIAMDLYLDAQGAISNRAQAKKQLNRRLQISRRWTELAGGCPLLLVIYSDAADRLIADRTASSMLLRAVGGHVSESSGSALVDASRRLRLLAEAAVRGGTSQTNETWRSVQEIREFLLSA
ncbi:hypothetical protein ACJZ2D_017211 [Fusarium nematophilum]